MGNTNPQTIYVVTSGEFSDYGIVGLFSLEPEAAAFATEHNRATRDDARVEEWPLDAHIGDVCGPECFCKLDIATGGVICAKDYVGVHPPHAQVLNVNDSRSQTWATATTPELAYKAANTRRQQILRKRQRLQVNRHDSDL